MPNVRLLLTSKGGQVWSVSPEMLVYDALQLMAEKDVGAVPVVENDRVVGIFSERDYARKVALKGKSSITSDISSWRSVRMAAPLSQNRFSYAIS